MARPVRLALLLGLLRAAAGVVQYEAATLTAPDAHVLVDGFGLAQGARVGLSYELTGDSPATALLLAREHMDDFFRSALDEPARFGELLCAAPSARRAQLQPGAGEEEVEFWVEGAASQFTLAVAFCFNSAQAELVARVEMVNPDPAGALTQHAAVELAPLEAAYAALVAVYALLALALAADMRAHWQRLRAVHSLGLVTLGLKLLQMEGWRKARARQSAAGNLHRDELSTVYMLTAMATALTLVLLFLIAAGWSELSVRRMQPRMLQLAAAVGCTCFVFVAVSWQRALCEGECVLLSLVEYSLQSFIMLGVLFSLNDTTSRLLRASRSRQWSPEALRASHDLARYRELSVAFVAFLLIPAILLAVKNTMLSWELEWAYIVAGEVGFLVVFVYVGVRFRPRERVTEEFF